MENASFRRRYSEDESFRERCRARNLSMFAVTPSLRGVWYQNLLKRGRQKRKNDQVFREKERVRSRLRRIKGWATDPFYRARSKRSVNEWRRRKAAADPGYLRSRREKNRKIYRKGQALLAECQLLSLIHQLEKDNHP